MSSFCLFIVQFIECQSLCWGLAQQAGRTVEIREGAGAGGGGVHQGPLFSLSQEARLARGVSFCSSLGDLGYPVVLQVAKSFF